MKETWDTIQATAVLAIFGYGIWKVSAHLWFSLFG
ncbi:putative membrane protein YpjA [Nocardioides massiliensis]|uniref:Membrane protein YpjA n=1 Tax=Nocardioides massiliensis TaxID=1325935 RepID=A0ABT9NJD2_9ACTN|nr:putative membrane protein YpjA [Nocardioides massiliensis]